MRTKFLQVPVVIIAVVAFILSGCAAKRFVLVSEKNCKTIKGPIKECEVVE